MEKEWEMEWIEKQGHMEESGQRRFFKMLIHNGGGYSETHFGVGKKIQMIQGTMENAHTVGQHRQQSSTNKN